MRRLFPLLVILCLGPLLATTTIAGPEQGQHNNNSTQIYLPVILKSPFTPPYDMVQFLAGGELLYEVQHSGGTRARHQTQEEEKTFYHTKGNEISAEWEELWATQQAIYRGTDTSPGNGLYYTLRDQGIYGSAWAPRYWDVGDIFERNPLVTFYRKSDCSVFISGYQRSWLLFEEFFPRYTFSSGITLNNVIQLAWLLEPAGEPVERYYYAHQYGLVGWWSNDRGMSFISKIHAPGTLPDNNREVIPCLDRSPLPLLPRLADKLPYWPGKHRR